MKIEPMKNRIDRTSENLAEMRALLRRYRKGRLDQLELEPENYC